MLLTFLRHVRRQSKTVRNNYALALAGVFTAVVAIVWVQGSLNIGNNEESTSGEEERILPFSNLLKQSKEQWAGAKMALKEQISGTSTEATAPSGTLPDSRTLILTDETINDQSAKLDDSSEMGTTSPSGNQSVGGGIEVQIATSSASSTSDSQ